MCLKSAKNIPELEDLGYLDALAEEYGSHFGALPFNISHWDALEPTIRKIAHHLQLPGPPSSVPYIYSYHLDILEMVLSQIGLTLDKRRGLIVPNGTSAILFAAWWLKAVGIDKLLIVCPSYFPIFHACNLVQLKYETVHMERVSRAWRLPTDYIRDTLKAANGRYALWLTNPVYCTGHYLGQSELDLTNWLLNNRIAVVLDECLCINGLELGRNIVNSDRFLGLYSRHKAICLNAVKFAALAYHVHYERFFDQWADVISRGLPASSYVALLHFISNNFLMYQRAFLEEIDRYRARVNSELDNRYGHLELDHATQGYFTSVYAPDVKYPC